LQLQSNQTKQQIWKLAALLLCLLLFVTELGFVYNAPWVGDYWEHRAVLKALILHPFQPLHPVLKVDVPHAFYSPYAVGLALAAKSMGANAEQILNAAALLNLTLFLYCVWLLVKLFLPHQNKWKAFTLLLLFILFCWGFDPPNFSSFYHFGTFPYVIAYPSSFSFICCVLAASQFSLLAQQNNFSIKPVFQFVLIVILLTVALLTHPLSFLFGCALFLYIFIIQHKQIEFQFFFTARAVLFAVLLSTPFALAFLWKYYPFYQLLAYVPPGNQVHADSRELYSSLYFKLFPLVFIPILFAGNFKEKIKKHAAVLSALAFLSILFFYGFISGSYGFGRMIAFIALLSQILLLQLIFELKSKKQQLANFVLLLIAALPFSIPALNRNINAAFTTHKHYMRRTLHEPFNHSEPAELAHRILFLEPFFKPGDVVLADSVCIKYLPGFGARVTASIFPAYWIADNSQTASLPERERILKTYQANYILLTPATKDLLPGLLPLLEKLPVVEENGIALYRVVHNN
jgi:hypothetical protein